MKSILLFPLFFPYFLLAQVTFSEISEAKVVQDHINLTLSSDSSLNYIIDDDQQKRYNKLDNKQLFQAKNSDFHIRMKYVNPLHYQVTSSNKSIDDELYKETDKYIENMASFIGSLRGSEDANKENGISKAPLKFKTSDPSVMDIYIRLYQAFDDEDITQELLNALMAIKVQETVDQTMDSLKNSFIRLYNITEFSKVKSVMDVNKTTIEHIDKKFSAVNDSIIVFEKMLEKLASDGDVDAKFQWLQFGVVNLKNKLIEAKKEMEDAKAKYVKAKNLFDSSKVEDGELNISDLKVSREKSLYEVNIVVKKLDFDPEKLTITVAEEKTYTIRVRKFQRFIPSVSTGAIYSGLKFKMYGTGQNANGETIVTEVDEELDPLNFGTYLNLQINNRSEITPLIQFGVSSTKNKPALMLGVGASFRNMNLSAGCLWTWVPQLNMLTVGQVVDGTAKIEKDIKYRFQDKPYFYLGLSFNIIKNN